MNITFLIGNGFDLNLGLSTSFSSFVNSYKVLPSEPDSKHIIDFKNEIKNNTDIWADAELQIGQYTNHFNPGEETLFCECVNDFCQNLSRYLQKQETLIDFSMHLPKVEKAIKGLNKLSEGFPRLEANAIDGVFERQKNSSFIFNFICYNYTATLEQFLAAPSTKIIGFHLSSNGTKLNNEIGRIIHVHGTTNKNMVLGVNDESQLANPGLFTDDFYKHFIIKQQSNEAYRENTDAEALSLLENSEIIYIYGMSIGATDNLWWERIANLMIQFNTRQLIIYDYNAPPLQNAYNYKYQLYERNARKAFMDHTKLKDGSSAYDRIHITNINILKDICDLATKADS